MIDDRLSSQGKYVWPDRFGSVFGVESFTLEVSGCPAPPSRRLVDLNLNVLRVEISDGRYWSRIAVGPPLISKRRLSFVQLDKSVIVEPVLSALLVLVLGVVRVVPP